MRSDKAMTVRAETVLQPDSQAGEAPRLWLLLGNRYGDNAQVLALGDSLRDAFGWAYEIKQLHYDPDCSVPFRDRGASLIGVDQSRGMPLTPPWPDIVIAIGKSAASVVRWIDQQAGGNVICVQLGRPRTAYHHFDLLVTTPQFSMPPGNNVIRLTMPITLHDEEKLMTEAAAWQPRLAHLPRPWTAVLIGGDTTQLSFNAGNAAQLVDQLRDYQRQHGGSFIVTTSPRTPKAVADKLEQGMPGPHFYFRWAKGAANPYQAFLTLADRFIITNDSVTMIAEAADRVKPIYLYTLPRRQTKAGGLVNKIGRRLRRRRESRKNASRRRDLIDRLFDLMTESGHVRPRNNIDWFEATLYSQGIARPLDIEQGLAELGAGGLRPWAVEGVTMTERNIVTERIGCLWAQRLQAQASSGRM